MDAFLQIVPPWFGGVGWLAVLVGFFLQRKALVEARNQTTIKGNKNQVSNTIHQSAAEASGGDSVLAQMRQLGHYRRPRAHATAFAEGLAGQSGLSRRTPCWASFARCSPKGLRHTS